jgi:hypothetical protein
MSGKLTFAPQRHYDLIEMDESTLADIMKQGAIIKAHEQSAALCTGTKTFRLKLAETSNQFLVVADHQILATTSACIEVT